MLKKSVLGAVLACTIGLLSAQEGSIDPVFDPGTGANAKITDLALQPDGKILIGGEFTSYSGTPRDRIARLDPNGGLDMSFDPGSGANDWVLDVAVQPDGKIRSAGIFTSYNGVSRNRIARLNTDGSLDETFIVGGGANADVNVLALQPDGKILIGGAFTVYRGNLRHHVARLNTDGSLDTSFDPGSGPNDFVFDMHMQADGKIVIGGIFTSCQGITRGHVARLSADGSLDAGLDPGTGTNDYVSKLSPRPDGRILMVGPFTSFNGTTRNRIMRLTGTGDLDATFNIGTGADQHVYEVVPQPDGKILIGGVFTGVNGMSCGRCARLDQEGGWDSSFNTGSGPMAQYSPWPSCQTGRSHHRQFYQLWRHGPQPHRAHQRNCTHRYTRDARRPVCRRNDERCLAHAPVLPSDRTVHVDGLFGSNLCARRDDPYQRSFRHRQQRHCGLGARRNAPGLITEHDRSIARRALATRWRCGGSRWH
ncbi:MAG: delta-60 repeat domain-containing protein [Flavobacteriales bacterium]|nr:delta-60 repeat domain-containing protein [Flavobacteriales bacterium]